ncbi:MAG: exo-alpha-sialidase [Oscillospiraceae bacterium]|nr:exo-alpha-sialidase [Oscillospiraceae bacterium]
MFEVEGGSYTDYRIPAMVVSPAGEIFVAYECRTDSSDWAKIDLRVLKSTDGGDHFNQILLLSGDGHTLNNPVLIAKDDTVHFLYCRDYARVFHLQSDDGGAHWREAHELTALFADLDHTVVATGPGHGAITPDGVMVVPVWFAHNPDDPKAHKPSFLTTIYSADGGDTWKRGEVLQHDDLIDANETAIGLTTDGSVLLSIRNRLLEGHLRYWAKSPNGYGAWQYLGRDERFIDPRCMGSLCNGGGRLFFSNCESAEDRINLTVKVSADDFKTFTRIPVSASAGYSEVAYRDGTLYVLYETSDRCGEERKNHRLHWKKIPMGSPSISAVDKKRRETCV